jgi:hypothetical protein
MSLQVRDIRRRHYARTIWSRPYMPHPFQQEGDPFDDWDEDDDYACTHCGGEGFGQVDDPLWDYCDEFGEGECPACDGTGLRSRQTVF